MHGLIHSAIEAFVCHTHGEDQWRRAAVCAESPHQDLRAGQSADADRSNDILDDICACLKRERAEFLEDLGTFLVSHPDLGPVRRLLRFCGETYVDFLFSLEDLPERVRLAVTDLDLPRLELRERMTGFYILTCHPGMPGFGALMTGILRAMADEYGTLAMLDLRLHQDGSEVLSIAIVDSGHAQARNFDLGAAL